MPGEAPVENESAAALGRWRHGYRYSRFCELYRGWTERAPVTMRRSHAGGDKLFVDYAGDTVSVIVSVAFTIVSFTEEVGQMIAIVAITRDAITRFEELRNFRR